MIILATSPLLAMLLQGGFKKEVSPLCSVVHACGCGYRCVQMCTVVDVCMEHVYVCMCVCVRVDADADVWMCTVVDVCRCACSSEAIIIKLTEMQSLSRRLLVREENVHYSIVNGDTSLTILRYKKTKKNTYHRSAR